MMIIGLTGSIAMGKSEAARILAAQGFPVFDADAQVHRLYDSAEGAALIAPFVPEATRSGIVDRKILSQYVLKDQDLLKQLEAKVHAVVRQRRQAFLAQAKAAGAKAVVLDIPLLFETGAEAEVDKTIVISAPPELQQARALARPGMTEERLRLILARQMPDADKRRKADAVIENIGTIADLQNSLLTLLKTWGIEGHA